jgi:G3E family GTPase
VLANREGLRVAVIVNDMSEVNIDSQLIANPLAVAAPSRLSRTQEKLVEFSNGCICCTLREDLLEEVASLAREGRFDYLLVESTGISEPLPVAETFTFTDEQGQSLSSLARLDTLVTVVDAVNFLADYCSRDELRDRGVGLDENDARDLVQLLVDQVEFANVIILNKADLVPEAELEGLLRSLHAINPEATLTACVYGKLDVRLVLEAAPYRGGVMEQRLPDQGTAQRYDIGTTVVRNSRPLHPQRFHTLYRDRLGLGIFRSKGFIWLASRPDDVLLWNQAGGAMGLEWLATWRVAILEGQGGHPLLPEEKDHLKKALLGTHPLFGDRGNELTVIGHARDRAVFCRELEECFCTDEEVEHWRQGGSFPDPWPTRIRETG